MLRFSTRRSDEILGHGNVDSGESDRKQCQGVIVALLQTSDTSHSLRWYEHRPTAIGSAIMQREKTLGECPHSLHVIFAQRPSVVSVELENGVGGSLSPFPSGINILDVA